MKLYNYIDKDQVMLELNQLTDKPISQLTARDFKQIESLIFIIKSFWGE